MAYIKSVERIGLERGRVETRLEGRIETLLDLLQDRFGSVPDWARAKLADLDTLKGWSKRIFGAEKIGQIFQ